MSVLMFSSVQYDSDATIWGGHYEFSEDLILIDSDYLSVLKISWEKCQAKVQVRALLNYALKAFITTRWQLFLG